MDMPKKIYVNEFFDGSENQWPGEHLDYIRADLVNELIEAVDEIAEAVEADCDFDLTHILHTVDKLKALESE